MRPTSRKKSQKRYSVHEHDPTFPPAAAPPPHCANLETTVTFMFQGLSKGDKRGVPVEVSETLEAPWYEERSKCDTNMNFASCWEEMRGDGKSERPKRGPLRLARALCPLPCSHTVECAFGRMVTYLLRGSARLIARDGFRTCATGRMDSNLPIISTFYECRALTNWRK